MVLICTCMYNRMLILCGIKFFFAISIHQSTYLSIYLSIYLSVYLSVYVFTYLSIYPFTYLFQGEKLEQLIKSDTTVFDILPGFFLHRNKQVQLAALEVHTALHLLLLHLLLLLLHLLLPLPLLCFQVVLINNIICQNHEHFSIFSKIEFLP